MFNSNKVEGIGLGLRFPHFDDILNSECQTPWFEVTTDDFLEYGAHHKKLLKLRESKPINLHSVGLNIGGVDQYDQKYLNRFKELYNKFEPELISDHLCWSAHGGNYHHDLMPIPKTKEALKNAINRVDYLQDFFNRELTLENITSYVSFDNDEFEEIDFIREIVKATGCSLLLDITNVITNHKNFKKNYNQYFNTFPLESVKQIHLAGGEYRGEVLIDTHSTHVESEDIGILKEIWSKGFKIPAIIERDAKLPSFQILEAERISIEKEVL